MAYKSIYGCVRVPLHTVQVIFTAYVFLRIRSRSLAYGRQPMPRILGFRSSHILPGGLEVNGIQCAVQGVLLLRDLNYRVIWAGFMVQLA